MQDPSATAQPLPAPAPLTVDYSSWSPEALKAGRFNVYDRALLRNQAPSFSRRDFYKISLLTGVSRFDYADRGVLIDRPALVFSNPLIPYSWEAISEKQGGYLCLFAEDFLLGPERTASLQKSPLFQLGNDPVFFLDEAQYTDLSYLFRQMLKEMSTGYVHKQDVLRSYVNLILHEALKMQPQATYYQHPPGAGRLVGLFLDLLERQFPVDSPARALRLRSARDYASHLSVHVNHLNRAVKELTGKTTTAHIAGRLIAEAKDLLQHTSWNTAEIAYGLGFDYPTNFNNFFKKHTGQPPSALRAVAGAHA